MLRYKLYQNNNQKSTQYGKWYARAVCEQTYNLETLAKHMSEHNTPFSAGVIKGVTLRTRATGNLSTTNLKLEAQLKEYGTYGVEQAS